LPEISVDTKARNYFCDDAFNRDWLKAVSVIREAMGTGKKFGRFVTIDDRIVFTGGPGQGGGGGGGSSDGRLKRATFDPMDSSGSAELADLFVARGENIKDYDVHKGVLTETAVALSEETGVPHDEVITMLKAWIDTSNDSDPASLMMQQEAAKIFGAPLTEWQQGNIDRMAGKKWPSYRTKVSPINARKVLHTMYDKTQRELAAAGVPDPVTLYRGISRRLLPNGQVGKVYTNTLTSYSSRRSEADAFVQHKGGHGMVAEIQIPRSRILGTPRTGLGCLGESEYVVIGATAGAGDEVMISYVD